MDTTFYVLGITLAITLATLLIVGLIATAKVWFTLVIDYWESSRLYRKIRHKGHLLKLASAAHALRRWSWNYPLTRDMNLIQIEEFYRRKMTEKSKRP